MIGDDPLGPFSHIKAWFPDYEPKVIFDIGAHAGSFARKYAKKFPNAKIYAFEPHPVTFQTLEKKAAEYPNIDAYPLALSKYHGAVCMTDLPGSTGNRVTPYGTITRPCVTGKGFCASKGIHHIDFVKIDTEAHDLSVLMGMNLGICDFVQVETMINRHDDQGSMYEPIYSYMVSQNFWVFNFYGFTWEWKRGTIKRHIALDGELHMVSGGAPIARRMDTVFINSRLVELQ